jgi:hypothetical protein
MGQAEQNQGDLVQDLKIRIPSLTPTDPLHLLDFSSYRHFLERTLGRIRAQNYAQLPRYPPIILAGDVRVGPGGDIRIAVA